MYPTRVWPVLILLATAVLAWVMAGVLGALGVSVLCLLGVVLAGAAAVGDVLPSPVRWCLVGTVVVLAILGLYLVSSAAHSAIHAVPFLAAVGGVSTLIRRWQRLDAVPRSRGARRGLADPS